MLPIRFSCAWCLGVVLLLAGGCGLDREGAPPPGSAVVAATPVADAVLRRVDLTGSWSIEIDDGFTAVVASDQITFADVARKVSVSSIRVDGPDGDAQTADRIRDDLAPKLQASDVVDRASFAESRLRGEAVIARHDDRWSLRGFMAADGSVASCMIDFDRESDAAWARDTWRSLRHP